MMLCFNLTGILNFSCTLESPEELSRFCCPGHTLDKWHRISGNECFLRLPGELQLRVTIGCHWNRGGQISVERVFKLNYW